MKKLNPEAENIIYKIRRHIEAIECDICHTIIEPTNYYSSKYFSVTTGHEDWGNDSTESIEHYDVCPQCLSGFVEKYLESATGTEYISIKTKRLSKNDYSYD